MLIGITVLKVMGLKPVPETPLKGLYMREDAPRLARLFDIPFRYHGLKGRLLRAVPRVAVETVVSSVFPAS